MVKVDGAVDAVWAVTCEIEARWPKHSEGEMELL